jgi:8-oxo-dGTP diphosphatase
MEQPRRKHIEVVAGLIFDGQKLLVCQRHHSAAFPLKWEFPGGKVEAGESAICALARELNEELDIGTGELKLIQRHNHAYADGPDVSLCFYQVLDYQGVIKNLVFEQIAWASLGELANFDFLEGDLPLVKQLANGDLAGQFFVAGNK